MKKFNHQELMDALYHVQDMFSRASIPFFVLDDTAAAMLTNFDLEGDSVHIGVRDTDWHSTGFDILTILVEAQETTKDYALIMYGEVPIHVYVFKNHKTIESPDLIPYGYEYFNVPNPYTEFEQVRSSLQ